MKVILLRLLSSLPHDEHRLLTGGYWLLRRTRHSSIQNDEHPLKILEQHSKILKKKKNNEID